MVSREAAGLRTTLKPVTRVFKRSAPGILRLTLESASGDKETLSTTPEHPFHVVGHGFVAAADLGPGDLITAGGRLAQSPLLLAASKDNDASGALKVKSLSLEDTAATVYNFEVAETHTYFVGRHKAWVHNTCSVEDLIKAGEEYLTFYHGTRKKHAESIVKDGILLSEQRAKTDFNRGFYTTIDYAQAKAWSARLGNDGIVVEFQILTSDFTALNNLHISPQDVDFLKNFFQLNRSGGLMHGYDTVSGPFLANPGAFMRDAPMILKGQQTSFHTKEAIELLRRGMKK